MNYFRIYDISRKMRVGEGWSASETCARQVRAMTESNQTCSASSNCPSPHKMALARFSPNNLICDVILRLAPPAGACRRSVTSLWVLSASQTAACWRMLPNKFICFNSIVLPSRASVCASLRRRVTESSSYLVSRRHSHPEMIFLLNHSAKPVISQCKICIVC